MVKKILSIVLWVVTGGAVIVLFAFGRSHYLETPLKGVSLHLERSHLEGFVDTDTLLVQMEAICDLKHHNQISNINVEKVNRMVNDNPWIEHGTAYIGLNDTLFVNAREYEPVLRVYDMEGRSVYVTAEGTLLPSSPRYTPHLMIASGHFEIPAGVDEALYISQAIAGDEYLEKHIGQIYRNEDEEFELTVNNLPAKVVVGDTCAIADKLMRLKTLLEKYNDTEELIGYKTLDLKYKNQIVCTKK